MKKLILLFLLGWIIYNLSQFVPQYEIVNYYTKPIDYIFPKIIHRTWEDKVVNKVMYQMCHEAWIRLNPDYTMIWYNETERQLYMKKFSLRSEFSSAYTSYLKLKPKAFRADLFRLCILYEKGGVYIDAHTTPFIPLDEMLKNCFNYTYHQFISIKDCKFSGSGINNGFIVSTPQHPFIKQAILDIIDNVENRRYNNHILAVTGPLCLAQTIKKFVKNYKRGWNNYGDLSFYLFELEYGPYQYIWNYTKKVMSKKYSFLDYLYRNLGTTYGKLWRTRNIYN